MILHGSTARIPTAPRNDNSGRNAALHVLLADDDPDLRDILATILRRGGHRVTAVANGDDLANEIAKAQHNLGNPIIVVTDLRMSNRTGLDVMNASHDSVGCPPFVLITAFSDDSVRRRAAELGAIAVLDKPFHPRELIDIVNQHARGLA